MQIVKTTITITVLRDADLYPTGLDDYELTQIIDDFTEGPYLGDWKVTAEEPVSPEKVADECIALRNDGAFFREDE